MANQEFPEVLLLGNGINRAFDKVSWEKLLRNISKWSDEKTTAFLNEPMPAPLLTTLLTKNDVSAVLKAKNSKLFGVVPDAQKPILQQLLRINFDAVLTTNYSYELEEVSCGITEKISEYKLKKMMRHTTGSSRAEGKYLLHTYNEVNYEGVKNNIWHIHGESRKPDSLILDNYYYSNYLSRLSEINRSRGDAYLHGECEIISWLDAFILGNVYVVGFDFSYSESDLWWLLERKSRENAPHGKVYFYIPHKESNEIQAKNWIMKMFDCQIEERPLESDNQKSWIAFYQSVVDEIDDHLNNTERR